MSTTLTKTYITSLEKYTSNLRELRWRVENWQRTYAEAGSQKEAAWRLYGEAIEDGESHEVIEGLFIAAEMYEWICRETYYAWQNAQSNLLALLN